VISKIIANRPVIELGLLNQVYQYDAYIKDGIIRKWWQKCLIELNFTTTTATVVGKNDSSIDLHFYLMRRSKNKRRVAFAL
jgi:hypothetical protein